VRILLDECIDHRLARDIAGHDVRHVRSHGWASLDDGRLLRQAAAEFDAFVAVDRGIPLQQNLSGIPIVVVVLRAKRNTRASLKPLIPALLRTLESAKPGSITWLGPR